MYNLAVTLPLPNPPPRSEAPLLFTLPPTSHISPSGLETAGWRQISMNLNATVHRYSLVKGYGGVGYI